MTTERGERTSDFTGAFGIRRGVAREFDALLADDDSESARAEATRLIGYVQRGDAHDALQALDHARPEQLRAGPLCEIAQAVAARAALDATRRWHFGLLRTAELFGVGSGQEELGAAVLCAPAWEDFTSELPAAVLTDMRHALESSPRVALTLPWLEKDANETARRSLIFAVSSELTRRGPAAVERLAGEWLAGLPGDESQNAALVAETVDQIAWESVIAAWIPPEPLRAGQWEAYQESRDRTLEEVHDAVSARLAALWASRS